MSARVRLLCRLVAITIAVVALIDPSITSMRSGRPVVSVVAIDALADSAHAARVREALNDQFVVLTSRFAKADGTVLVGRTLPTSLSDIASPVFAVTERGARPVHLATVRAPASASMHAPVHIDVVAERRDADGAALSLALQHDGVIVDRVLDTTVTARTRAHTLTFVPTAPGTVRLRVLASSSAGGDTASADVIIDIHDAPLSILVFDPRPSYQSTFVRRALERDPRLRVTSRTVTSRGVSTSIGVAPSRLDDAVDLARFDAIVVGAPEALSDRDVNGLERFLRDRGGSVLLLLDARARGPFERLTGVREWRYRDVDRGTRIVPVSGDTASLRASQQYAPASLPDGAVPIARAHTTATDSGAIAAGDVVLWSTSVGVGRLLVSGALDAWRYREREVSGFDRVWQRLVVDAASIAVPPVTVTLARSVLAPREETAVTVSVRSAMLPNTSSASAMTRVSAGLEIGDSASIARSPVQLWPSGQAGELRGIVSAPGESGVVRLVVTADGHRTATPLLIDPARRIAAPDGEALLAAWVMAQGGTLLPLSRLEALPDTLAAALQAGARPERWYPMRSMWWLLPFALALSAEWWLRRRSGLA